MCDLPEFYTETYPKGRKEHRCEECGGTIRKGQRHFAIPGKWSGIVQTIRQHLLCHELWIKCREEQESWGLCGDELLAFGGLFEDLEQGGVTPDWWPTGVSVSREALREFERSEASSKSSSCRNSVENEVLP